MPQIVIVLMPGNHGPHCTPLQAVHILLPLIKFLESFEARQISITSSAPEFLIGGELLQWRRSGGHKRGLLIGYVTQL